jgi:hypothetical protein
MGITFSPVGGRKGRSRYAPRVGETLKAIRGDRSAQAFAERMSSALGQTVYKSAILNWEHGRHVPGADVLLAALATAGANRLDLPSPVGADAESGAVIDTATRLNDLELKVAQLQQFRLRIEEALRGPS